MRVEGLFCLYCNIQKDEAAYSSNQSTPRIYLSNKGTEELKDFKVYYYFMVEDFKSFNISDYYTPRSSIKIDTLGFGNYRICYDYSGYTLAKDGSTDKSGNAIGLNYTNRSNWDKSNDYSNSTSSHFVKNEKIIVYDNQNRLVYGNEPRLIDENDITFIVYPSPIDEKSYGSVKYYIPAELEGAKLRIIAHTINGIKEFTETAVSGDLQTIEYPSWTKEFFGGIGPFVVEFYINGERAKTFNVIYTVE